MNYEPLFKIYRKEPDQFEKIYRNRFDNEFSTRLGIFIKEYRHQKAYEAFFCNPGELTHLLIRIEEEKFAFNRYISTLPHIMVNHLMNSFLLDEIQASNEIEGIHSSRRELKEAFESISTNAPKRFKSIIIKYKKTLSTGEEPLAFGQCPELRNFYDEFLGSEINEEDLPDGKIFRKEGVDITTSSGKVIHQGLYPEPEIVKAMKKSLDLLHDESILLLIRIALFHYLFGYIHPFYDGNGRTSRFISSYYISSYIHPLVGLRLSRIIKGNQTQYYEAFKMTNSEINRGDLTYFIIEFLKLLSVTMQNTRELLERRLKKLKTYEENLGIFFVKNHITDELTQKIYFILLQESLFSVTSGVVKNGLVLATKKTRKTIDQRFKSIPENHLVVKKVGRFLHYKLNTGILKL